MEFFQHLFEYKFLSNALIISIIVGIVCGTVGCLIVLRGLCLMGHSMRPAVLSGVAGSFFRCVPVFIGALVTRMIASIFIGFLTKSSKSKPDGGTGISFTASLASGDI